MWHRPRHATTVDMRSRRTILTDVADPLILTLAFDDAAQARFQAARDAHFPPDRNVVPAHATLFNHLPGDRAAEVCDRIGMACAAVDGPLPFEAVGIMPLGKRGCAYRLSCPGVEALRSRVGAGFALADQDRGARRLHVTVQNKADPAEAKATLEAVRAGFAPFAGRAVGVRLWWYRGGPWEAMRAWGFGAYDESRT